MSTIDFICNSPDFLDPFSAAEISSKDYRQLLKIYNFVWDAKEGWPLNTEYLQKYIGKLSIPCYLQMENLPDASDGQLESYLVLLSSIDEIAKKYFRLNFDGSEIHETRKMLRRLEKEVRRIEVLNAVAEWERQISIQPEVSSFVRSEIIDFIELEDKKHLSFFGLSLTSLPDIFKFKVIFDKLEELYCGDNQLKDLPAIDKCTKLKIFHCYANLLESLPSVETHPELEEIDCSNNENLSLLPSLEKNTKLKELGSGYTALQFLPSLGRNTVLEKLYFNGNELASVPISLGSYVSLRLIDFSDNPGITGIPNELIFGLTSETEIDFSGCSLSNTVLDRIREITSVPDYDGPRISFSVGTRQLREEVPSIEESLGIICENAGLPFQDFPSLKEDPIQAETLKNWLGNNLISIVDIGNIELSKTLCIRTLEHLTLLRI